MSAGGSAASSLNKLLGVEPPERATVNLPELRIALCASPVNSVAATGNNSAGVGKTRTFKSVFIAENSGGNRGYRFRQPALRSPQQRNFVVGDDAHRHGFQ